jgi:hypothetical protein
VTARTTLLTLNDPARTYIIHRTLTSLHTHTASSQLLPDEELASFERLFFQLQEAYWFYCDNYTEESGGSLPGFGLRTFCLKMFQTVQFLQPWLNDFDHYWK